MPLLSTNKGLDTNSPQNAINEIDMNSQDIGGVGRHAVAMGYGSGSGTDNTQETNPAGNSLLGTLHSGLNGSIPTSRFIPLGNRGYF